MDGVGGCGVGEPRAVGGRQGALTHVGHAGWQGRLRPSLLCRERWEHFGAALRVQ